MELLYISRYDRHCLEKLIGTSTEERLIEEGHIFTLSDGTEYERVGQTLIIVPAEEPPE
jgi:hypothetical protein